MKILVLFPEIDRRKTKKKGYGKVYCQADIEITILINVRYWQQCHLYVTNGAQNSFQFTFFNLIVGYGWSMFYTFSCDRIWIDNSSGKLVEVLFFRTSHSTVFNRIVALKSFARLPHLSWIPFSVRLQVIDFSKKKNYLAVFSVSFPKYF